MGNNGKNKQSLHCSLTATSNGTKGSLNNTSGGHCKNEEEAISLRIKFTLCDASFPSNSFNSIFNFSIFQPPFAPAFQF